MLQKVFFVFKDTLDTFNTRAAARHQRR